MDLERTPPPRRKIARFWPTAILTLAGLLSAVRLWPWTLDEYDQAKQAYTSYEMVTAGRWWYQHSPDGEMATKPPLAGWVSAGLRRMGLPWEAAWRLPSFLAALILAGILFRWGEVFLPGLGGFLAAAAFLLNTMTPKLATLVRTDMLLALWTFGAGATVLAAVRDPDGWTPRRRWGFGGCLLAALLTKGPAVFAFLLPGLAGMALYFNRKKIPGRVWPGWTVWMIPLLALLAWAGVAAARTPDFYEQVILREFLGRFYAPGGVLPHESRPFWYYLVHLAGRFLPWTLVILFLGARPEVRGAMARRPDLFWLLGWAAGAWLVMSLIPSKRPDRIYPLVPGLALLIPAWAAELNPLAWPRDRIRRWALILAGLALAIQGGSLAGSINGSVVRHDRALVEFGRCAGAQVRAEGLKAAVLREVAFETGLVLYSEIVAVADENEMAARWSAGDLDAAVVSETAWRRLRPALPDAEIALDSDPYAGREGRHLLLRRNPR